MNPSPSGRGWPEAGEGNAGERYFYFLLPPRRDHRLLDRRLRPTVVSSDSDQAGTASRAPSSPSPPRARSPRLTGCFFPTARRSSQQHHHRGVIPPRPCGAAAPGLKILQVHPERHFLLHDIASDSTSSSASSKANRRAVLRHRRLDDRRLGAWGSAASPAAASESSPRGASARRWGAGRNLLRQLAEACGSELELELLGTPR